MIITKRGKFHSIDSYISYLNRNYPLSRQFVRKLVQSQKLDTLNTMDEADLAVYLSSILYVDQENRLLTSKEIIRNYISPTKIEDLSYYVQLGIAFNPKIFNKEAQYELAADFAHATSGD